MSDTNGPDPGPTHDPDQLGQANLVRDTGNPPTEPDEEAVLYELYGEADADGVYGPRGETTEEEGDA